MVPGEDNRRDATGPPRGLSSDEAARRLRRFGANASPDVSTAPWRRLAGKFWAPVPWMLEVAIVLQIVAGEVTEAAIIASLLVFNAALGFVQESRADGTLRALRSRLALNAAVRRDGDWRILPAMGLVPGDLVKLSLGGVVAADVRLVDGAVAIDNSTITGESVPVDAGPGDEAFAGALVRRGEAVAEVTATGPRTRFGRAAELVRTAHTVSSQQRAVFGVVRTLAVFNGAVAIALVAYARWRGLGGPEIVSLVLTAVLASIPVALPATFTLAAALAARSLAARGVLSTRLSAVDEAAAMDVLCVDKTGTLTRNTLAVDKVVAAQGFDENGVLALASAASAEGGLDVVDNAVRAAAAARGVAGGPARRSFTPFDPETKTAEASLPTAAGTSRVVKGAFAVVARLSETPAGLAAAAAELERGGLRVLGVATGPAGGGLQAVGLLALSDPPREDARALIAELRELGVAPVMVTGDAPETAAAVARAVGLEGAVLPPGPMPADVRPDSYSVIAGVRPEDKHRLVEAFQKVGHVVGMCGDGVNDAPALRQAQIGLAVSTATDVAKSAAGMVLTEPGLAGVVDAVKEGRLTFQRIGTYALMSIVKKIVTVLLLAAGLVMTGRAVLTPYLMVIILITGDFLSMSLATDRVRPSPAPNVWRVGGLALAGLILGACQLAFSVVVLVAGRGLAGLGVGPLRTLAFVATVFGSQATLYAIRQRRRFRGSPPSVWVLASTAADIAIGCGVAIGGLGTAPLPAATVGLVFAAALAFGMVMDVAKLPLFARLRIT